MKHIHLIFLTILCSLCTACMDGDWDEPGTDGAQLYGNPDIRETNVITIEALKAKYSAEVSTEGLYKQITQNLQIKAVVTANDIQGNMYNEIAVQDETGAIFIGIAQGGVYGYLPVGTEILIDLNGLYIGNYRKSPTIGTPYVKKSENQPSDDWSVSRMPRALWQQHFTYTGYRLHVVPEVFADGSSTTTWDITKDSGKLGVLKNVTIKRLPNPAAPLSNSNSSGGYYDSNAGSYVNIGLKDASTAVAPDTTQLYNTFSTPDNSTSWYFNEQPDGQTGGVQIYTSNYADFAAMKLPAGKVNITGVMKRYRDQWEIIIRSIDDVEEVK